MAMFLRLNIFFLHSTLSFFVQVHASYNLLHIPFMRHQWISEMDTHQLQLLGSMCAVWRTGGDIRPPLLQMSSGPPALGDYHSPAQAHG